MDETELRLAALELLMMELLAIIPPDRLAALEENTRQGLPQKGEPGDGGDEQTIRLQALQIVADAKLRGVLFTPTSLGAPKGSA
ncbi:hypothetical protein [Phenylobacterium deserti]|nr:hypothetical protein [Phenylobacterium deserti]